MRLHTILIIALIIGIFSVVFTTMLGDSTSQDHYDTGQFNEFDTEFGGVLTDMETVSERATNDTAQIQADLQEEEEISLITIGGATIKAIKTSLQVVSLTAFNNLLVGVGAAIHLDPVITGILITIMIVFIIFTIVYAIIRWKG